MDSLVNRPIADSEGILTPGALHTDPTQFGEFLQRSAAPEPTPTTIFHTAKGRLWLITNRLIVYMDDPRFDALGNGQTFRKIRGENSSRKPVHRIVCHRHRLLFIFDLND